MPDTNRDVLMRHLASKIEACLKQNPVVFPSVTSWLRATPGIVHDTSAAAPPVVIGWINQVLINSASAVAEVRAQQIGDAVASMVKAGTGTGSTPIGTIDLTPSGHIPGDIGVNG